MTPSNFFLEVVIRLLLIADNYAYEYTQHA